MQSYTTRDHFHNMLSKNGESSKGKSSGTTTNGYAAPTPDEESQQSSVLKLLKDAKDVVCISYHHVDKKRFSLTHLRQPTSFPYCSIPRLSPALLMFFVIKMRLMTARCLYVLSPCIINEHMLMSNPLHLLPF